MRIRPFPRSWPLAGLLVFTGACSIFTDLSELTQSTTSAGGTGGTTSVGGTGGAKPAGGTGGASTSTASSSSATGSGGADCSGVNEYEDPATSHCYFYDRTGTNDRFSDAETKCSAWAQGGHLVAIETAAEASFLFNTVNLTKDTWIGLSDQAVSGTYLWVTSAPLTYTDWDVGFPNDAAGQNQCVGYADTLKWQNASCSATRITLCERP